MKYNNANSAIPPIIAPTAIKIVFVESFKLELEEESPDMPVGLLLRVKKCKYLFWVIWIVCVTVVPLITVVMIVGDVEGTEAVVVVPVGGLVVITGGLVVTTGGTVVVGGTIVGTTVTF
jgi:hypothetical protein